MNEEQSAEVLGSTALSVALGLMMSLVNKDVLSKEDGLDIFDALIEAKEKKAQKFGSAAEREAGQLLAEMRERFAQES